MARAQELGLGSNAIFAGFRTDTSRFLRGFDISVLPSLTEGLSNTLMESMAAGLPVVATRVGGTPEVVVDGTSGVLVKPGDASALAESLCRLINDRNAARRIGEAGRRRIAENFSMQRTVEQTENLYCELMGKV
jgi:glycosyltransferase involved in cell wall biosynthesis